MKNLCAKCWMLSLVLLLMAAGASFAWTNPMTTNLAGLLGPMTVNASASKTGTIWTYTYELNTTGATRPVTTFSVGDLLRLPWFNTTNTGGFVNPVFNPADTTQDSVLWTLGNVAAGQIVTFTFQSELAPGDTQIAVRGSGRSSGGPSIGLVPEPASIVALSTGMFALAGALVRRRKSS